MVRVFPGSGSGGDLKRRGIITTTVGNDVAYYRNSIQHLDTDPRIKSTEFEKTQKDLLAVNKIWNNRPDCWKDHFKRAFRDYSFGAKLDEHRTKRLTGYDLYFQLMLDSFKSGSNHFYDPPCFCIQPIDPIGEIIHSYGNFKYFSGKRTKYKFDEVQMMQLYSGCSYVMDNPFTSAAFSEAPAGQYMYLSTGWSHPRKDYPAFSSFKWEDFYSPVLWPQFSINDDENDPMQGSQLWDCCDWVLGGGGVCECPPGGQPLKCISFEYVKDAPKGTLCMRRQVRGVLKYGFTGIKLLLIATDAPPYKYVWFGGSLVGVIGLGYGTPIELEAIYGFWPIENNPLPHLWFDELRQPCVKGEIDCNSPKGEILNASGVACTWTGEYNDCKTGHLQSCVFTVPRTVNASVQRHTPEFRVTVKPPEYDGRGFQNWCPWGGIKLYVSNDGVNYTRTYQGNYNTCCTPGKTEYCFDNRWANMNFKFVKVIMMNTTAWPCCTLTTTTGLQILDKYPPDDIL